MYETNIFVKFKFHFSRIQIFITKEAQIVITPLHTKDTNLYLKHWNEIFWRYLTSDAPLRSILFFLNSNCLDNLCSLRQIFFLSEFSTTKDSTPYNTTLEESSLCNTRSRPRSEENTLPMSLKWIFIRNAYHFRKTHSA
jgi:hypothetical protein